MSPENTFELLEKHITMFPSRFDDTNIARQLREIGAPVLLYGDVRDRLWVTIKELRNKIESYEKHIKALKDFMEEL